MKRLLSIIILLVLALPTTGCTLSGGDSDASGQTRNGSPPPTSSRPSPGLTELDSGQVRVIGWLTRIELGGGFWTIMDGSGGGVPGSPDDTADSVIVVIANPEAMGTEFTGLEGMYVQVEGILLDGKSVRMARPEIEAQSVTVINETSPE